MTSSEPAVAPKLYRNVHGRVIGGVAGALADHLGLRRSWVRLAFVALTAGVGLGLVLYGAFWIVLRTAPDVPGPGRLRAGVEFAVALVVTVVVLVTTARAIALGRWFVPSVLACFGGALLWRQSSETERDRWRRLSRSSLTAGTEDRAGWLRIVAGVAFVVAGAVFVLASAGIAAVGAGLAGVAVTVIGLGLITGPWWLRLGSELTTERRERIRSEERADIAAHLHDSVLQTLALIQRNADRPREVTRLARSQERELRSKLYGDVPQGRFAAALQSTAADIEDTYAIAVNVVVVGDLELQTRLDALLAATREALVNAAKHAQVTEVSVYAEVDEAEAVVFVRDRGVGFDPDRTDGSRLGIRGSIVGRLERHHGRAEIRSKPAEGTEVQLRMRLT